MIIFEKYFAIMIEIMNAIIAERIIAIVINNKSDDVSDGISLFIATALPVLDLFIEKRVINDNDITKVFTIPMRIRNSFLSSSPIT